MRRRVTLRGASTVIALAFLFAASTAQAFMIQADGDNATGILNLDVAGTLYDVVFEFDTPENIYGEAPGIYDFDTSEDAEDAMIAVNDALDSEPNITSVGPAFDIVYEIPYAFENDFSLVREGLYIDRPNPDLGTPAWLQRTDSQPRPFRVPKSYAVFTPVPEPLAALMQFSALVSVAVLGRSRRARCGAP